MSRPSRTPHRLRTCVRRHVLAAGERAGLRTHVLNAKKTPAKLLHEGMGAPAQPKTILTRSRGAAVFAESGRKRVCCLWIPLPCSASSATPRENRFGVVRSRPARGFGRGRLTFTPSPTSPLNNPAGLRSVKTAARFVDSTPRSDGWGSFRRLASRPLRWISHAISLRAGFFNGLLRPLGVKTALIGNPKRKLNRRAKASPHPRCRRFLRPASGCSLRLATIDGRDRLTDAAAH